MPTTASHVVLEARVGPRLEQRLGAGRVTTHCREMQRRPLGGGLCLGLGLLRVRQTVARCSAVHLAVVWVVGFVGVGALARVRVRVRVRVGMQRRLLGGGLGGMVTYAVGTVVR